MLPKTKIIPIKEALKTIRNDSIWLIILLSTTQNIERADKAVSSTYFHT